MNGAMLQLLVLLQLPLLVLCEDPAQAASASCGRFGLSVFVLFALKPGDDVPTVFFVSDELVKSEPSRVPIFRRMELFETHFLANWTYSHPSPFCREDSAPGAVCTKQTPSTFRKIPAPGDQVAASATEAATDAAVPKPEATGKWEAEGKWYAFLATAFNWLVRNLRRDAK